MNRDIASDLGTQFVYVAIFGSNTTITGTGIDTAHYDGGVMLFIQATEYIDGTYTVTLQDSPDNSVWTDVPANKLILPSGSLPSISALPVELDALTRMGAFSTERWLRINVTSTGVTSGGTIVGFAVNKGEIRPVA